jgi:hypothetical protein
MFGKTQVTLLIAILLGSTSAALAGTHSKHHRHNQGWTASARSVTPWKQVRHSSSPAFDVYNTRGHYIGSDPDPFIRSQLARDPAQHD